MQAPGGWVPKEVGYGDPRVRALAMDLFHLLPLYELSFPVALKSLLDLSCPFLQLFPSCPHPSSEGTTSALPTAGGASQALPPRRALGLLLGLKKASLPLGQFSFLLCTSQGRDGTPEWEGPWEAAGCLPILQIWKWRPRECKGLAPSALHACGP